MSSSTSQQWIVHTQNENDFDGLELKKVDIPKPGDYEVLLKIYAVSLNFRDVMISTGTYMWPAKDQVILW